MAALVDGLYDAIVVGCGAAGMTVLSRLTASGLRVVGLEASSRRGGRVHTVDMGGAVELGAEWIHGEVGNEVFQLARRHRIPITKDEIMFDVRRSDGSQPDRELCDELLAFCWLAKEEAELSERPAGKVITEKFYEYIKGRSFAADVDFCEQFLRLASLISNNYDATNDWNDISVAGSQQYHEPEGHLHWSFGDSGYETIFKLIENNQQLNVRLNSEVTRIGRSDDIVAVQCADGTNYKAKHVIVTVSLGVLKERYKTMFAEALPRSKIDAITSTGFGVMDKICLRYSERWWPGDRKFCGFLWRGCDAARVEEWMTGILGFSATTGAANVITLWTSGDVAKELEVMPEERLLSGCKALLQMFMGERVRVPDALQMRRSTWWASEFTRGSYSYRPTGRDPSADLAAPVCDAASVPRILFAGEACSARHYSTVHGAIETGLSAADAVLRQAKMRSQL